MESTSAVNILERYYQGIMYSLPMRDVEFLGKLQNRNLLPKAIEDILESLDKSTERASYFLDNVIKPELQNDSTHTCLDVLLEIMMDSGYDNMVELATKVKSELPAFTSEPCAELYMDKNAALELLNYCYHILASSLPMDDNNFVAVLSNCGLLPGNTITSLESLSTSKEKASYFLNNVIKPQLNENDITCFGKLLAVMVSSDNGGLRNLAAMISSAATVKSQMQIKAKQQKSTPSAVTVLQRLHSKDSTITLDDIRLCNEARVPDAYYQGHVNWMT
ncbi:uncharacterized protein [Dysidea avara]|uniref:uncharacterized protein isoform X2 n=1 Tax=Dysidea avara TaxID=196820 RepID=UPI00331E898F